MRRVLRCESRKRKEASTRVSVLDAILPYQKQRITSIHQMIIARIENFCNGRFGFKPDVKLKIWVKGEIDGNT